MKEEEQGRDTCEFKIHPNNFKVEISEIKPICAYGCIPVILDIKVRNCSRAKSSVKIKLNPCNGILYFVEPSTYIYKAKRGFCGMDIFQLCFRDEYGEESIESILVNVKRARRSCKHKIKK
ncbi:MULTISPECIES: hypothetical protein [Clostridium]|uniref:Uncharacterized protein n=1 Tax=Clostridium cibarium TaxID=2762247 RepID=A0ABR8PW68_9CLOT|nr:MULTISPECIES: hypothetical protein [Clostridium]MBD7912382.1 hypothetical protein [Clostridium cibarium]